MSAADPAPRPAAARPAAALPAEPIETAEILAFATTVEARSLSRAASQLGVPRATLGRRLARLEARLGVRLLRRTTRSLALTDAGEAFLRHAHIVLDALRGAQVSVQHGSEVVRGDLRVSIPPRLDPTFGDVLFDFARRYPEVRLHVNATTQHVDLVRGGYDVALRASSALEPGLVARTLGRAPLLLVASPGYLAAHGVPRARRELSGHRCLLGFARGELPDTHWPAGKARFAVEGVLATNDVHLLHEAARAGIGVALLPELLVREDLERGTLVRVLEGQVGAESQIAVVYPERELVPPHVRAFIDAVVAWGKRHPLGPRPLRGEAAGRAGAGSPPQRRTAERGPRPARGADAGSPSGRTNSRRRTAKGRAPR